MALAQTSTEQNGFLRLQRLTISGTRVVIELPIIVQDKGGVA